MRKQCRGGTSLTSLFTPARRIEAARIVLVGVITFLFWRGLLPLPALIAGVAIGLYPLVKTGIRDLVHEHKVGTEIFVTVATLVALAGREYVAASVLMTIILIAEFIADLNTDRACVDSGVDRIGASIGDRSRRGWRSYRAHRRTEGGRRRARARRPERSIQQRSPGRG